MRILTANERELLIGWDCLPIVQALLSKKHPKIRLRCSRPTDPLRGAELQFNTRNSNLLKNYVACWIKTGGLTDINWWFFFGYSETSKLCGLNIVLLSFIYHFHSILQLSLFFIKLNTKGQQDYIWLSKNCREFYQSLVHDIVMISWAMQKNTKISQIFLKELQEKSINEAFEKYLEKLINKHLKIFQGKSSKKRLKKFM